MYTSTTSNTTKSLIELKQVISYIHSILQENLQEKSISV